MRTYAHIAEYLYGTPWAILPSKFAGMSAAFRRHAAGVSISAEDLAAIKAAAAPARQTARSGTVAVLPLTGVISQRASLITDASGGTSTEVWRRIFSELVADPQIGSIILDVDSPGGSVYGIPELWDVIASARVVKPVIAVANAMAASAAYWLATAASELVVTPSGQVGSIGVFASHTDLSKAAELEGVRTTLVSAGKYKTEANPYEPLSEEARAALQAQVDAYYGQFVAAVAKGRGVSASDVRSGFGEGRMVNAQEAVRLGMADLVGTLEDTIRRLAGNRAGSVSARTQANILPEPAFTILDDDGDYEPGSADLDLRQRRLRLAEKG